MNSSPITISVWVCICPRIGLSLTTTAEEREACWSQATQIYKQSKSELEAVGFTVQQMWLTEKS